MLLLRTVKYFQFMSLLNIHFPALLFNFGSKSWLLGFFNWLSADFTVKINKKLAKYYWPVKQWKCCWLTEVCGASNTCPMLYLWMPGNRRPTGKGSWWWQLWKLWCYRWIWEVVNLESTGNGLTVNSSKLVSLHNCK